MFGWLKRRRPPEDPVKRITSAALASAARVHVPRMVCLYASETEIRSLRPRICSPMTCECSPMPTAWKNWRKDNGFDDD